MSHRSASQLDREIAEAIVEDLVVGHRDVTQELLHDASRGPGETVRMIATTKPARNIEETPTLRAALEALRASPDRTMGHISKALAYSHAMPRYRKRDHANLIRLMKGGHVSVCEVSSPPPAGSIAHQENPSGHRHYVLHVGPCGAS